MLRLNVSAIKVQGRATMGVRLINLDKRNDEIASVCCVDSDPEEEVDQDILVAESEQSELEMIPEEIEESDDALESDDELMDEASQEEE